MDDICSREPSPTGAHLDTSRALATKISQSTLGSLGTTPNRLLSGLSILRLVQCTRCSRPLRLPLRLPCGNTFCRSCLPPTRKRVGISYPVSEGREQGFTCYWEGVSGCVGEHCVGDCATDVLMTKLVDVFEEVLEGYAVGKEMSEPTDPHRRDVDSMDRDDRELDMDLIWQLMQKGRLENHDTRTARRARLVRTAESSPGAHEPRETDRLILEKLKETLRTELDCQVCYSLILDPLTTPCGHTFCQKCVGRVLDHSDLCPICRRKLNLPPVVDCEPINKRVAELINSLYPEQVAERRGVLAREESGLDNERTLPLFVCTLSFPTMPTFLHIFEPRYRLMMRRVMENGGGKFGMVMYNRTGRPQGDLGRTQFVQYGTLLKVDRFELFPDGRSLVIATGLTRFKVLESGMLDGYYVGKVERVDDISLTEEETLESMETSAASNAGTPLDEGPPETPLASMSTQALLQLCLDFVQDQQSDGATWLNPRVLMAYGQPPTDPARFPWWLASVLPVSEDEKYSLLSATSVRERLKITADWVRKLESRDG